METYYSITFAIVALIFIGETVGFVCSSVLCDMLHRRLGRAKAIMLCDLAGICGSLMLACSPPYPVVVLGFFTSGFGYAIGLALNNVFASNLTSATTALGLLHGCYGIGGVISPLIGTAMVSHGINWSRFYLLLLGLRFISLLANSWANHHHHTTNPNNQIIVVENGESRTPSTFQNLHHALTHRATLIGALLIFAYQGAEVTLSAWTTSFLLAHRTSSRTLAGYAPAGFWAGVALGRFALTPLAPRWLGGPRRAVVALGAACIALELLAWLVPSAAGSAAALGLLGLVLGPVYPVAQAELVKLVPGRVQVAAVSFVSGAGYAGGAVAPFATGLLAQAAGTRVVHPVALGGLVVMMGCWAMLPQAKAEGSVDVEVGEQRE
jgi:fucose permease